MARCAKCGTTTEGGQFYRFYCGQFVDDGGQRVPPGPFFHATGSAEVYYCDRCLLRSAARAQLLRSTFHLVLGVAAAAVLVLVLLTASRGWWLAIALCLVTASLAWAASRRYRQLRGYLNESSQDRVRQFVSSDPVIQNMGDEWAIACRRQTQQTGAESLLTCREYAFFSEPEEPT